MSIEPVIGTLRVMAGLAAWPTRISRSDVEHGQALGGSSRGMGSSTLLSDPDGADNSMEPDE
jgi:hypothetical protein